MSLEKRVAIITGATGGLGSIASKALAENGISLALFDHTPDKLAALVKDLSLPESRILEQVVDLLDPAGVNSAVKKVIEKFGKVDILLHVVGGWTGGKTILEAPAEDLTFMLNQHIWTSFNILQAVVPHLINNGWGRIIMITSPFASRPTAKGGPYAIGKSGQEALMLTLSQELKGSGVTANLLQAKTIDAKHEKYSTPTPNNAFWTTPEELVSAMLYLLSEEAGTINGAKIPLYGSY
jgi:NAD(P)-dependent dehydrogenase (short-subunit alcohol dehydrogenase family)